MSSFLSELGSRLADRWLSLLILPGALYLAVAAAAGVLGWGHALDLHLLITTLTAWAKAPPATTAGGQVVLVAGVLAGAAAVGLTAQALGAGAERLALAADWRRWPRPMRRLAQHRVDHRRAAWQAAHADYHRLYELANQADLAGTALDPDQHERRHAAFQLRTRISLEQPDRPTWSGDRVYAPTVRLRRDLNLNLPTVWPALWLQLPDTARTEISTARQDLARATTLAGWVPLYAPLVWWWWPALPIALLLAAIAWRRTRNAVDTYALLIEAAVRLYTRDLAQQLGIDPNGAKLPNLGATITHHLLSQPAAPPVPPLPAGHTEENRTPS